jgi:hypothetical protein
VISFDLVETDWHLLSLGAGVQSSTLALMAAEGEVTPMPQAAIFADTQAEPASVYKWLDWLEAKLPFPVHRVTKGSLWENDLRVRTSKTSGRQYKVCAVPMFVDDPASTSNGMILRKCTRDFKVYPILRKAKEICGVKRGQKEITVTQWIGISTDERQRMKASGERWAQNRWPLIELGMSRYDCLQWWERRGYPMPPRSACVFCPYHSNKEWQRLKTDEPEEFARAVEFERQVQEAAQHDEVTRGLPYLHVSKKPIDQVDFSEQGQTYFTFGDECDGMCGV